MARRWRVFHKDHNPGGRFSHEDYEGVGRNMRTWRQPDSNPHSTFYGYDSNIETSVRHGSTYVIVAYDENGTVT